MADEGARRQHAAVVEVEKLNEAVTLPRGRRRARSTGRRATSSAWASCRCWRRSSPGELRSRLPASPPEQGEPFAAVLRDLDEVLLPGDHALAAARASSRYFAVSAAEPGILAELLAATLNQVGDPLADVAGVDRARGARRSTGSPQLLGLPAGWHGHIEDTRLDLDARRADRRARATRAANVVVCSEHAHSSVEKAARMLGMELRKVPADEAFRLRPDALDLDDVGAVVATVGTTSTDLGRSCRGDRGPLRGRGHVAARRRRVRRLGDGLPRAPLGVRGRRSRRLARRQRAQVDAHADGLLAALDAAGRTQFRAAFTLVPEYLRTTDEAVVNLSEYGPALGRRFRSLKLWAVLRCYGARGAPGA